MNSLPPISFPGPFTCPLCCKTHPRPIDISKHVRGTHGIRELAFRCSGCGRSGPVASISVHYRWCTRGDQPRVPSTPRVLPFPCTVVHCPRSFSTYTGMRLHMARAHATAFNESLSRRKNYRWSDEERQILAQLEATFNNQAQSNAEVNKFIQSQLKDLYGITRSIDSIKGQRKYVRHREAVASLMAQQGRTAVSPQSSPCDPQEIGEPCETPTTGSSQVHAGPSAAPIPSMEMNPDDLAALLNSSNVHYLSTEFTALLTKELSTQVDTTTSARILSCTARFLTAHFADNQRGSRKTSTRLHCGTGKKTFIFMQHLFHKDRKRLLDVIAGKPQNKTPRGTLEELSTLLSHRISKCSPPDMEPYTVVASDNATGDLQLITEREIVKAQALLQVNTASGPDRVPATAAKKIPAPLLAKIFNLWLFYLDIPSEYKVSRTVLLPKGDPLTTSTDFRPISISSTIYRLFSKIIAMRLADHVNLNLRQKGFVRGVDGCNTNIRILQACIQEARWRGTELAIAFLDLAKAFDSVSHNSILRALKRHAVPIYLQRLIENMLTGGSTVVELSSRRSAPLPIRCGVKQGDPISPLLFNLVLDELFERLDQHADL
ncbi:hypothetical protein M514_28358, partial [Trichuris suis]